MNHFIEIHSLNIKPGRREGFHQLYIKQALPLLKRWNFDVVAHGPSLHDEDSYYLLRRFDSSLTATKVRMAFTAVTNGGRSVRQYWL